jgi:photosystem II stability/assembly factor-like uncharacterized protein
MFALLVASPSFAKAPADTTAKKPKTLSERLEGMQFRCIGPYRAGRVTAVAGVRGKPLTFYFGATGGGVWRTQDGGSNWENLSDKFFKTGSVGAIAVAESDPNVIVAGMGEAPIRGNLSSGDGIWRSVDGGVSWTNVGLKDAGQVARVRIDPRDPDRFYVAVQGHAWGPNPTRGIYRTLDGGKTWKRVLAVNDSTGACDLAMDPNNPRILYAAFWQVVRRPWELVSGGKGSGLWRSIDGGESWKEIREGLPEGILGKITVSASPQPGRVWALVEAAKGGGLYRSDDRGDKWTEVNDDHSIRQRPWYFAWIYADTKDPEKLWAPNLRLYRSSNGGKSFEAISAVWDHHDLWIDPDDPNRMIVGTDGGAAVTFNGGRTWSSVHNQPTAQFYRVITDDQFPYRVYGSQQDNSSIAIPSASYGAGIGEADWIIVGGGESGYHAPDPRDPDRTYGGEYGGAIFRWDRRIEESRDVTAAMELSSGRATRDLKYRFQWNAPILVSHWDSTTVYHAAQKVLRSRNEGETWEEISPDLTRNDPSKLGLSGGPITRDITGVEVYCTIFALAESPIERGVLWAGSDDGLVHVTRDGGRTWQNVTPKGMPEWIQVNAIDVSAHEPGAAYVAATRYKFDDGKPYLYRTRDFGKSWTPIVSGIPEGAFARVVREDPVRRGLLFAGTETGLYVSFDDGGSWTGLQLNLPATPITDLTIKNGDLVVSTQGRSFWILDDLTPLRLWSPEIASARAHLFPPRAAYRANFGTADPENPPHNVGTNPPYGVIVNYWLQDKPKDKEIVRIEIFSGDSLIRAFSSEKPEKAATLKEQAEQAERDRDRDKPLEPKAGLNRFAWDMRIWKPTLAPRSVFTEGERNPPRVGAGTYRVRLRVGSWADSASFEVRPHPRGHASPADLRVQFDLLAAIRDRLSETHLAVLGLREAKTQAKDLGDRAERMGKGDGLKKRAAELGDKLTTVERELTNPDIQAPLDGLNYPPQLDNEWTYLAGIVGSADRRPTAAAAQRYQELKARLDAIQVRVRGLMEKDVAEFNREVMRLGIPPVAAAPRVAR